MQNNFSCINYKGQKIGTFIIKERVGTNERGYAEWEGVCELCGEKRNFITTQIKSGKTSDCSCVVKKRQEERKKEVLNNDYKITLKDYLWKKVHNSWHLNPDNLPPEIEIKKSREILKGRTINDIQILYPCGFNADRRIMYVCKCFCGNYFLSSHKNLKNGNTKSCDCLRKQRVINSNIDRTDDIIGKTFDLLYVESFAGFEEKNNGKRVSLYNCICTCGRHCVKQGAYLRCGDTKSCGLCNFKSKGEVRTAKILEKNNIPYKAQYRFDDCLSPKGNYLYFDFGILDQNNNLLCLIEYDGEQHYNKNLQGFFTNQYDYIHERDVIKNEYCQNNNIKLYRIRFDENLDERMEEIINGLRCKFNSN